LKVLLTVIEIPLQNYRSIKGPIAMTYILSHWAK